jgi:uncharacterized membrane protein
MLIAAIRFYDVVVWVHVLAVVVAFGVVFAYPVLAGSLARAGALQAFHATETKLWSRVVTPAMVVVLIAGIYLASDADVWSEAWVSGSLVGLILLFAIAGIATGWERRAAELAPAGGAAYEDVARRLRGAAGAAMGLVVIVLFLMIVKP